MAGFTVSVDIDQGAVDALCVQGTLPMLVQVGNQVVNQAKALAPVDTGYLRSTIHMSVDTATPQVSVGASAEYAGFVHDGTRYMPGRPFLADALRAVTG